jgi:transposase
MARPLHFHKPTPVELRALLTILETATDPIVRQRAEVIIWLGVTSVASEIAELINLHLSTVLYYIRCFHRRRLRWVTDRKKGGPPRLIPLRVQRQILAIAQQDPADYGLDYGTWSLTRLRWFVTRKRKLVKRISREHLRRILKKGGSGSAASNARSTRTIPAGPLFWPVFPT